MENDEQAGEDRIFLMTLHAAKGLEFDTVFLPGWEEGLYSPTSVRWTKAATNRWRKNAALPMSD